LSLFEVNLKMPTASKAADECGGTGASIETGSIGGGPSLALQSTFIFLGLSTSVLWNQLLLSSTVLISLFGDSALAHACLAQNLCSALTMIGLTMMPIDFDQKQQIQISAFCFGGMLLIGGLVVHGFMAETMTFTFFGGLVGILGLLTGLVQLQIGSLAGVLSQSRKTKATDNGDMTVNGGSLSDSVLMGNTASPLVTTAVFMATQHFYVDQATGNVDEFQAANMTLGFAMLALLIGTCLVLSLLATKLCVPEIVQIGDIYEDGFENQEDAEQTAKLVEYVNKVIRKLKHIGWAVLVVGIYWIFFFCQLPYIDAGLTVGTNVSPRKLTPLLVATANVAAFCGCFFGQHLSRSYTILEAYVMALVGISLVYFAMKTPVSAPTEVAIMFAFVSIFWCSSLVIRLFARAQATMGHSLDRKCPITSQVTWVALQTGCVTGTLVAMLFTSVLG